jgi:hypothetical protein
MAETRGRRVPPETPAHELEPGDYRYDGSPIMWAMLPNGELIRVDERWQLVEEADETITAAPLHPGENHSIRVDGLQGHWHGHLVAGTWREC